MNNVIRLFFRSKTSGIFVTRHAREDARQKAGRRGFSTADRIRLRFFTINRAGITPRELERHFRIIPHGVAQYSNERIGASRWRMSIEKPKRSLRCSFARLGPGSGMALETHPRDFGTKSSAGNSAPSRLSETLILFHLSHRPTLHSRAESSCIQFSLVSMRDPVARAIAKM